jgi:hypothetical protein
VLFLAGHVHFQCCAGLLHQGSACVAVNFPPASILDCQRAQVCPLLLLRFTQTSQLQHAAPTGMWLLNTNTAELQWFADPNHYAILSHVWDESEETFQHVRGLTKYRVKERWSHVSPKVANCCKYVKDLGFHWVWIDTCCIDKSSSAELFETINSMYRWYSEAALCIAFLKDVEDGSDPRDSNSSFCRSKWFKRGWTLQELIAPWHVVFVSKGWRSLSTKTGLASTIEEITGIDVSVLCH